ncbi:hypothetical protein [Halobellus sp. GM3]|uniref:hypothetical protein n=1 Tax=Halobellus sp. GM3 TaxID=3458410 RepID=UPI00403E31F3
MVPVHLPVGVLQLPFDTLGDLVTLAGTLLLFVFLLALGAFAYQSLTGDGIRWPDETDVEENGVERRRGDGDDEDEWKYY